MGCAARRGKQAARAGPSAQLQHTLPGEMAGAMPVQGARGRMDAGADGGSVPLGRQSRRQKKGMECAGFEFEGGEGKPIVLKRIDAGGQ